MLNMSFRATAAALMLAGFGAAMVATTAPAAADEYTTDVIAGAAVGALVGTLLFDHNRGRYYYVSNYRRCYVSDGYAERWHRYHGGYGYNRYAYYHGYGGGWRGDRGWYGHGGWHDHGGGWRRY